MFEPIYNQIAEQIKDDIASNRWEDKLPGVGVLSGKYNVAPRTISKAVGVLAEQGLVTTHGTRGTFITQTKSKRPRYGTIGVVGMRGYISDHSRAIAEVERLANNLGYQLLFLGVPDGLSQATAHLHIMPVDGLIFANSTLNEKIVVQLRGENMPFVSMNRFDNISGLSWVEFDNEQGLELALSYLHDQGHKRIAYVGFEMVLKEHQKWLKDTYKKFMTEIGSYDPDLWLSEGTLAKYSDKFSWENIHEKYGKLLAQKLLEMSSPPTAIYTSDYKIASGVSDLLQDAYSVADRNITLITKTRSSEESEKTELAQVKTDYAARMCRAVEILVDQTVCPSKTPIREFVPYELIEPLTAKTKEDELVLATA